MAVTGFVEFKGVAVSSTPFSGTYAASKSNDDDRSTFFASASASASNYVGQDMGSGVAVVPDRAYWLPRIVVSTSPFPRRMSGSILQYSDDGALWTSLTSPFLPTNVAPLQLGNWNTKPVAGAAAHRFWRFLTGSNIFYDVAELCFEGAVVSPTPADYRPCRPTINNPSGRYAVGQVLTPASRTTSATVYWTTDGSTPTNASSTGPITLGSSSSQINVKAIAYDTNCPTNYSEVVDFYYSAPKQFCPLVTTNVGEYFYDKTNYRLEGHHGGILDDTAHSGYYYWAGASMNANPPFTADGVYNGICLYRSTDLYNWETPNADGTPFYIIPALLNIASEIDYERVHIIRNPITPSDPNKQYTLICHALVDADVNDFCCIGYAPTAESVWTIINTAFHPGGAGVGFKDCNIEIDPDNNDVWVVATTCIAGHVQYFMTAYLLDPTADNVAFTATSHALSAIENREGMTLKKRNGRWWLTSSQSIGYGSTNSNVCYQTATTLAGLAADTIKVAYSSTPTVGQTLYSAQPTCMFQLPAPYLDAWIMMMDLFDPSESGAVMYNSGYVWGYVTFPTSTTLQINVPTTWDLNVFAQIPTSGGKLIGGGLVNGGLIGGGLVA